MKRGEIWWIDFNTSAGGEIQKTRPAIIISNDYSNQALNRIQVIPVTSNIAKCYPCEAYIKINGKQSKAMADHIMTVSKLRFKSKLGHLTAPDMHAVEHAIRVQLDL